MRIAIISPLRSAIIEPMPGGIEAFCLGLAQTLRRNGHQVEIFAGHGSDEALGLRVAERLPAPTTGRHDVSNDPMLLAAERRAYEGVINQVASGQFDVVHDNSMHDHPIRSSVWLAPPVITTFHTPPITRVARAIRSLRRAPTHYVAVSRGTARMWSGIVPDSQVISNGADLERWSLGSGGGPPAWSGRLVEEKGVTLAIRAARLAGTGLRIAGRCQDRDYFESEVEPMLGGDIEYLGHLTQPELGHLVRTAKVALVTPCWEEPYGLVAAEAIASGTPVAGFDRGALGELNGPDNGVLVPGGDVHGLSTAILTASRMDRAVVRRTAEAMCSLQHTAASYELLFSRLLSERDERNGTAAGGTGNGGRL